MNYTIEDELWPPEWCPALSWPVLRTQEERLDWYKVVVHAYRALWEGHSSQPEFILVSEAELEDLEATLRCKLPEPLRVYHQEMGALSLREQLCAVSPRHAPRAPLIQPLKEAYPGIVELKVDEALLEQMIVFSDYLGDGNMFCFHAQTQEVYYFSHDNEPTLSRFFPSVDDYLEAVMMRSLAEIYEEDDIDILVGRFGENLVNRWMY